MTAVMAYPSGAGSCPRGKAAVGGSHILGPDMIRQGTLDDGAFQVTIGETVLIASSNDANTTTTNDTTSLFEDATDTTTLPPTFEIDTDYEISVLGTRYAYKGCLIRMQGLEDEINMYAALLPGTNMGPAFACFNYDNSSSSTTTDGTTTTNDTSPIVPVTGISHTDNPFKQIHSGTIRLSQPGTVVLDITVVGMNNDTMSLYAYSEYIVQFIDPTATNTTTTTNETTTTTTATPSSIPTSTPTVSPTAALTSAPSVENITATTASPTVVNSSATTESPVASNDTITTASPTASSNTTVQVPTVLPPNFFEAPSTLISQRISRIVLQIDTVSSVMLSSNELRTWERLTRQQFEDFYNMGNSGGTNNGTRYLQSLKDNYGVVPGSMSTILTVTNATLLNTTTDSDLSSNTTIDTTTAESFGTSRLILTYDQQLDYRRFNNTKYYGPLQYATLPFRSRKFIAVYTDLLADTLSTTFSEITVDSISVPKLYGPLESELPTSSSSSTTSPAEKDDPLLSDRGRIGIIVAGTLVGTMMVAALAILWSQRDHGPHDNVASLAPDFDRGTFSFGGNGNGTATDLEASSDVGRTLPHLFNNNKGPKEAPLPNEHYIVYAPAGRLGIVLDSPDSLGPVVYVIKESSPLFDQIEVGDRLVAVDEVDVRAMSPTKVSKLISKRSGNPMRKFTLIRRDIVADATKNNAAAANNATEGDASTAEVASHHSRDPPPTVE